MDNTEISSSVLQQEIDFLRKQLSEVSFKKTSELNTLRSKSVQLETDLSIANAELTASTNENSLLRQQMSQLVVSHTTDKTAIKNSLKEFESRLDIKNRTIDSLSLENEKLKKEAVSYKYTKTQDVHALNVKVTELDTIVSIIRTETSNNVDAIRNLFKKLTIDHDAMKLIIMELESYDHSHSNPQLEGLLTRNNRMDSLMRDIGLKLDQFNDMSDKSTELFAAMNKLTNENNELSVKLNKTYKKLNSNILKLQNDLIAKNTEIMNINTALSEVTVTLRNSEQSSALKYSQLEALYQTQQTQLVEYQKKYVSSALSVRDECNHLLEENSEKQRKLSAVELEVTEWMTKYNQLNGVLVSLREDLTQCKLERSKEMEQHADEVKQLRSLMQITQDASLARENDLKDIVSDLQSQCESLKEKLSGTKDDLMSRETEISEVKRTLEISEETVRTLEEKLAASEDENQKSLQQCSEILTALQETEEELQQTQSDLETKLEQVRCDLTDAEGARDALQTQYNNLEANFNAVIEENNQYSAKMAELTLELETLQDRMQSTDLIQQQMEQTTSLKIKALNATIAELQMEKAQLTEEVQILTAELSNEKTSFEKMIATNEQLHDDLKACERVLLSKQAELQQLERDVTQRTLELADAKLQTQMAEAELATAQSKIEELNGTLNGRSVKYKATQSKVVDLEKSLAELRRTHKQSSDEQQGETDRLKKQIEELVQELKVQAEKHLNELSELQREVAVRTTEIIELKGQLSQSKHEVVQLETALLELRNISQEEQTNLMASVCSLESDNNGLSLQLSEQLSLVETKQTEIEELNDQLVEARFRCDGLSGEIAKHLSAVKQWEDLHAAAEKSGLEAVAEMECRLNAANESVEELRVQLLQKDADMELMKVTLRDTESCVKALESERADLMSQLLVKHNELQEKLQVISHLESTLKGMQVAAQSTIDNQSQLIDSLEGKHAYFQQTLTGLSSQLQMKNDELKSALSGHREAVEGWEARCKNQEERIAKLELDVIEANQSCADVAQQRNVLLDANATLETELAALRSSEVDLKNSQSILKNDYSSLDANYAALVKESNDLKAALASAENALQSVSQQQVAMVNKLSTKLNHRNDAIKVLKAEIVRLKDGKRNDNHSLSSMLTGLQSEFDALHQQIAEFSSVAGEPSNSVNSSVDTFNSTGVALVSDDLHVVSSSVLPAPPSDNKSRVSSGNNSGFGSTTVNSHGVGGIGNSSGGGGTVPPKSPIKSPSRIKLVERSEEDFIEVRRGLGSGAGGVVEDGRL